jgi:hypothetical protein
MIASRCNAICRRIATALVCGGCLASAAVGQTAKVTISGGPDASGQNYRWTVTNNHSSPIVFLSFPHVRADTFRVESNAGGWTVNQKEIAEDLKRSRPGVCTATAKSARDGVRRGRRVEIFMRLARGDNLRGSGTVTARFADDTEFAVAGVRLPRARSWGERLVTPIGFGLILILIVLARRLRRKPAPAAEQAE